MSPDNSTTFRERLAQAVPADVLPAAEKVFEWVTLHPKAEYVEAGDVLSAFKEADPLQVVAALGFMSSAGILRKKYAVAPRSTHTRLGELFDSIESIPEELEDWKLSRFEKDDAEVYPVFVPSWGRE
ncbi:MAG TPA: hypothetical protein VGR35_09600 [Tepidisphaeraceae bacterium]|nr:hypothetical protein [Tepidisphaeraceae bacterium]